MDLESQVTQYFLFVLDLCKDPNDVFAPRSAELRLAQSWLEKLCLMVCDSLAERRLRNVYLSNLCVCLNDKELRGPFLTNPPQDKLDTQPDFKKAGAVIFDCEKVAPIVQRCGNLKDAKDKGFVNCPAKKKDEKKDVDKKKDEDSEDKDKNKDKGKDKDVKIAYMYQQSYDRPDLLDPLFEKPMPCPADNKPNPSAEGGSLREDVQFLLSSIAGELRGEQESGVSEYLECELVRYKEFLLRHPALSSYVTSQQSSVKLRCFLLLNLQNDLVKLLNDGDLEEMPSL